MGARPDLIGQKFGEWTVLSFHSASRNGHTRWLCYCSCGKEKDVFSTHLLSGASKSCGCKKPRGSERKEWTGHGLISGRLWNQIVRGANGTKGRRIIPLEITIKDAWEKFENQQGKCALSGIQLSLGERYGDAITASLDRIDSEGAYTIDNIQWLHKDVNRMKSTLDQIYFQKMCGLIAGSCEL